jgi:hypothetical protein
MFDNSPYFNRMNSSIAESITDKIIYNTKLSCSSIKDDLDKIHVRKPVQKSIDYVITSVKEANDSTKSVFVGNIGSAVINGSLLFLFKHVYDGDLTLMPTLLRKVSFGLEVGLYTAISAPYFYNEKRKEGLSRIDSIYQVLRFGVTGAAISFTGYWLAKKEISKILVGEGMIPEVALPLTQILLTYPFALTVALLRKPMGYATDMTKDYIVDTSTRMANGVKTARAKRANTKSKIIDM